MIRRLLALLFTGALLFVNQGLEAKNNKIDRIEITSIEDLLAIDDWDRLHVVLVAEEGAIWRGKDRKDIEIEKAKDFILDGGEHPPTIYGHAIKLHKSKDGEITNIIARLGSIGYGNDEYHDAIVFDDCKDIEVNNCSFSWGTSGVASVIESEDIDFKGCIFAEPLIGNSDKGDDVFDYGCLVKGSEDVSFKECLFVNCPRGNPVIVSEGKSGPDIKLENSIIFGYSVKGTEWNDSGDDVGKMKLRVRESLYVPAFPAAPAIYVQKIGKENSLKLDLADNEQNGSPVLPVLEDDERVKVDLEGRGRSVPDLKEFLNAVGAGENRKTITDQRLVDSVRNQVFSEPVIHESTVDEFEIYNPGWDT